MDVIRQHYVPQELLRNFSVDNKQEKINMIFLKDESIKYNVDLSNQAKKKFYYGKDQRLEKAYSILESNFSSALRKLATGNIYLSDEEDASVRVFMVFQMNRTPEAVNRTNSFITESMKELVRNSTLESSIKDHIDDFTVSLTQPHDFLFNTSLDIAYTVSDLKMGLIENVENSFVIGQSPVYVLNPFLQAIDYNGGKMGLGVKGAIVLMPVSPKYTVILYDLLVYGFEKHNKLIRPSKDDIYKFNLCQFLKTNDCVYFSDKIEGIDFNKLSRESENYRNEQVAISNKINLSKDNKKYLIWTGYKPFPFIQNFDCIHIREDAYMTRLGPYNDIERPVVKSIRLQKDKNNEWIN